MSKNIKLGTLVNLSAIQNFRLHDIQYDITEYYTKAELMQNKQLLKMKVLKIRIATDEIFEILHVEVEE